MNTQATMRIGEVHALLRRDVPDIELSKIRYYEDKGLVQPTRSRKGYRLYSQRDVECLREAIRLAHEEFVPLRVVRLRLIEQGLLDDAPATVASRQVARSAVASVVSMPVPSAAPPESPERGAEPSTEFQLAPVSKVMTEVPPIPAREEETPLERQSASSGELDERWFSASEFLTASGLEPSVMNKLMALGLVRPRVIANQNAFSMMDLRVVQRAGDLVGRGVERRFLGSLRRNVEREIGLLDDIIEPVRIVHRGLDVREVQENARSVGLEIEALRRELFARALDDYVGD